MGLDQKQFLGDTPQAKEARLQTLRDMLKDVESDEVFRSIVRSTQVSVKVINSHYLLTSHYFAVSAGKHLP